MQAKSLKTEVQAMTTASNSSAADADHQPASYRIGLLAAHEIRRIAREDPLRALTLLQNIEASFRSSEYQADGHLRHPDGSLCKMGDEPKITGGTNYFFLNDKGTLILHIAPPGPLRFSEDSIWLNEAFVPSAFIVGEAIGRMPSRYVDIKGYPVDELAPQGITSIERKDIFNETFLVLGYPVRSIDYASFAQEVRDKARENLLMLNFHA